MKLESVGIIIGMRPFGERDAIARIFTREYGVLAGMLKAAQITKKNRPLVGQYGNASWNARLESQLGAFHWESVRNLAALMMSDAPALGFVNSSFALLATLLPEREAYRSLFDATIEMIQGLGVEFFEFGNKTSTIDDPYKESITRRYLDWEICLLQSLGYALDLSKCSGCGRTDNLTRLSKKTGRAVCSECAAPYLAMTFPLPIDTIATGFFLEKAAAEMGTKLPMEREMIFPLHCCIFEV